MNIMPIKHQMRIVVFGLTKPETKASIERWL
jgi:hypothetical protein